MQITNLQNLLNNSIPGSSIILKYGDRVFITHQHRFGGFTASVYEFLETPDETGLDERECRLSLLYEAEDRFEDSGHAVAWCLTKV